MFLSVGKSRGQGVSVLWKEYVTQLQISSKTNYLCSKITRKLSIRREKRKEEGRIRQAGLPVILRTSSLNRDKEEEREPISANKPSNEW